MPDGKRHEVKGFASATKWQYAEHVTANTINWCDPCYGGFFYYDPAGSPAIAAATVQLVTGGTYVSKPMGGMNVATDTTNHKCTLTLDATRAVMFEVAGTLSHNGGAVDQITMGLYKNGSTVSAVVTSDLHVLNATTRAFTMFHIEASVADTDYFQLGVLSGGGNTVTFYQLSMFLRTLHQRT